MFSWKKLSKNFMGLAPMAGYTDSPYRRICKEMGADILYSELISATGLFYNPKEAKTLDLCRFEESERPFVLQLFGKDPEHFVCAIKALFEAGIKPDGIDINMGCPVNKVVKCGYGSALIREPSEAIEIIKRIKEEFDIPVSVKTRSGWDGVSAPEFAKELEKAGADAICIHARTYKQGFTGKADWSVIKAVKDVVSIPVMGNGDIKSAEDARRMLEETGCDGVLIGRGALGNPFIFQEIKNLKFKIKNSTEVIETLLRHIDYAEEFYGPEKALRELRKHYGFYLRGYDGSKDLRMALVRESDLQKVKELLKESAIIKL